MNRARHLVRHAALAGFAAASVLGLAACGDDGDGGDEGAAEEPGICEARADLDTSFAALGDIDIVNDGTDALREAVDAIAADVEALREAAGDEAADEVDAVEESYDAVVAAVGDLGEGGSIATGASAVGTALADFGTALGDLAVALTQECD